VFEPADSQEAYDMTRAAYRLSEAFKVPVLLRLTTRICHVKGGSSCRPPKPMSPAASPKTRGAG
jgi:indolepyruvate ferredoxin oxidoreductase alpha subunit